MWSDHLLPSLEQTLAWAHAHRLNVILAGEVPFYDNDHLTADGPIWVTRRLWPMIATALAQPRYRASDPRLFAPAGTTARCDKAAIALC